jgi:hypothetical protein
MTYPIVLILDMRYADPNYVGLIPTFLDLDDPRPAKEQFAERYEYGGWRNQDGFTAVDGTPVLQYPGDPPLKPIACMTLPKTDEIIFVYLHGYVSIFQKDGSFEACRMD